MFQGERTSHRCPFCLDKGPKFPFQSQWTTNERNDGRAVGNHAGNLGSVDTFARSRVTLELATMEFDVLIA